MPIDGSAVGTTLPGVTHVYTEREVILYALGVGCGPEHLAYTYEVDLKVLPTFAVVPAFPALAEIVAALRLDPLGILHTEHRVDLLAPIPTSATIVTTPRVEAIYDRRVAALIVISMESVDERGAVLFRNTATLAVRGEGGFGGPRGPSGIRHVPPSHPPDAFVSMATSPNQALLYRLSGDRNPLHVDPQFAQLAGFPAPILHGLCTFGFTGRAVLESCGCGPEGLRSLAARFSAAAFPGDTLAIDLWRRSETEIALRARTQRGDIALTATAELSP